MGQPPKCGGKEGSEFAEWAHKMQVHVSARVGADSEPALLWAGQQRRDISEDGEGDAVGYSDVWNDDVDGLDTKQNAL